MYTADTELCKDTIEVSLDGRQIFYLFFGGAVIASMVFVLGVMVGRRVEARSFVERNAVSSAALDPLAALDQLEGKDSDLAFPDALRGDSPVARFGAVDDALAVPEKTQDTAPVADDKDKSPTKKKEKQEQRPAKSAAKDESKAKKPAEPAKPAAQVDAAAAKFTLQLSSFQAREDAEKLYGQIKGAGSSPYIAKAEVPDKGTWYRVRVGYFKTYDDALAGKTAFEKRHKIIAYVTRLR
jgi:cell division septation protein DedD